MKAEITVDGVPLKDWLKDNDQSFKLEVKRVRIDTIAKVAKAVSKSNAPKSKHTSGGRGRGNPGVKRPRILSQAEIDAENRKRGLLPFPRREGA